MQYHFATALEIQSDLPKSLPGALVAFLVKGFEFLSVAFQSAYLNGALRTDEQYASLSFQLLHELQLLVVALITLAQQ